MTDAEIEITADLVHDLLREQHPDLAGLAVREVPGGWGNQMWRLGDELAVRMQRMDPTPERQLKERRWLPVLAPRLPLPVPTPVRFGEPSERFPKHWTVMTWVPGEPLDHGSISRGTGPPWWQTTLGPRRPSRTRPCPEGRLTPPPPTPLPQHPRRRAAMPAPHAVLVLVRGVRDVPESGSRWACCPA
ncbi:phosphotransferase [Actinomadura gamaensis]|uniref:Phosphotransferase n=1 Tax=Actinomadura gamaensis TaxID=1763541 RepID=A0ABV9TW10_9ACTN